MYKWLAETEPDQIPSYAHHMIGVGGFVVNEQNQVLVISERFRHRPHLKLPGGIVYNTLQIKLPLYYILTIEKSTEITSIFPLKVMWTQMKALVRLPFGKFLKRLG